MGRALCGFSCWLLKMPHQRAICVWQEHAGLRGITGHAERPKTGTTAPTLASHLNTQTQDGWTPLHHAAAQGHAECVKALISTGARLDRYARAKDGRTAYALVSADPRAAQAIAAMLGPAPPLHSGGAPAAAAAAHMSANNPAVHGQPSMRPQIASPRHQQQQQQVGLFNGIER